MKRKLFCFLLAMIMMLAVVACGENTPPDTDEETLPPRSLIFCSNSARSLHLTNLPVITIVFPSRVFSSPEGSTSSQLKYGYTLSAFE